MQSPIDNEIRQRVIAETDRSFALSAGAGSGKTSVLVQRLVSHLLAGTSPERIAAITFTEKAASELAERTRDALEEQLAIGNAEQREIISHCIAQFGKMTISTIHSFCQDILRLEAFEAGWVPHTELADDMDNVAFSEVYHRWRQGFEQRHPEWAVALRRLTSETSMYGGQASLSSAAMILLDHRFLIESYGVTPLVAPSHHIDWDGFYEELCEYAEQLAALASRCQDPAKSRQLEKQMALLTRLERFQAMNERSREAVLLCLDLKFYKTLLVKKKSDWDTPETEQAFVDTLHALESWCQTVKTQLLEQLHHVLMGDMLTFLLPQVQQAKRSAGQASYADLLSESARILIQNAEVRHRLAEHFQVILIDEVQDTDPIQAEVAALLTRPPAATGDWDEIPPVPGALFAVGDPKQSIYRFRGADVDTWRRLQALIAMEGESLSLLQNFRSVPGLVRWFNHCFAGYPGYEAQAEYREDAALPPVVLINTVDDKAETDGLIRHLLDLKRQGAQIVDRQDGQLRPMRWGDVMILLPAWTKAEEIQEKLTLAGIDYVVEGGKGFFDREEIRLMIAALRALEEPLDADALILVLRGFFGLSHDELAQFRADGGLWRYNYAHNPGGPVADAFQVLRRLHEERSQRSWVELLDALLEETHASAVWSLMKRGRGCLANLDKLKMMLRELELKTRSPGEVVKALREQASGNTGVSELSLLDEDLDAVCITTIFQAKGLEAPVIALVHARRKLSVDTHVVNRMERMLAVRVSSDVQPPGWTELAAQEKQEREQEFRRLMYVAATRARDHLIIVKSSATDKPRQSVSLLKLDLLREIGDVDGYPHDSDLKLAPGVVIQIRQASALAPVAYNDETFPGWDEQTDQLLRRRPHTGDPEGEARENQLKEAVSHARRRSVRWRNVGYLSARHMIQVEGGGIGPLGGTVIHQVMQQLDLSLPMAQLKASAPGVVRTFARLSRLSDELTARCLEVVERLLEHPVIDEARAATERWQEVPFAYRERGRVVSGQIDLCFPVDEGRTHWKVVDWKSHLPAPGSALHEVYRRQLEFYTKALLATVTPCEHVDATLVGPHQEIGFVESWEESLGNVCEELAPFVQDLQLRGYPRAPEVGLELGDSEEEYVELELAWSEDRLGLGLDLTEEEEHSLEAMGWRVVTVDTTKIGWAQGAIDRLLGLLGLPAGSLGDDAVTDNASSDMSREALPQAYGQER